MSALDDRTGAPRFWRDVLAAPAFVINLDSRPERFAASLDELARAGFTDVRRMRAVDARDPEVLAAAWAACGSPALADWDTKFHESPGRQGCFLSHLALWKEISNSRFPFACIFEDDVVFHRHWAVLAPTCFDFTPRNYEVLFMGSQIEAPGTGLVRRVPVHCTHAYLITGSGAERLRSMVLNDPNGVATIDSMFIVPQWREHVGERNCPFDWYAWDGTTFPDARAASHPEWQKRNSGLVFQNMELGSDIEPTSSWATSHSVPPVQEGAPDG